MQASFIFGYESVKVVCTFAISWGLAGLASGKTRNMEGWEDWEACDGAGKWDFAAAFDGL